MKLKTLFFAVIITLATNAAIAQKLPTTQQVSLRAPDKLKIDGKATEWNNQLQAYNKATDIFYTIANDDENIYLVVQAVNPRIVQKIINVGLTFTVSNTGKKNEKENVSFTYPLLDISTGGQILYNAGAMKKSDLAPPRPPNMPVRDDTVKYSLNHTDSLTRIANRLLANNANKIKITGIAEFGDEPISVYNENKIKIAAMFDNGTYTYELAIPLKYLNLSVNDTKKAAYGIRIDGRLVNPKRGLTTTYIYPSRNSGAVDIDLDLNATTDFWAEYTLAKKQ